MTPPHPHHHHHPSPPLILFFCLTLCLSVSQRGVSRRANDSDRPAGGHGGRRAGRRTAYVQAWCRERDKLHEMREGRTPRLGKGKFTCSRGSANLFLIRSTRKVPSAARPRPSLPPPAAPAAAAAASSESRMNQRATWSRSSGPGHTTETRTGSSTLPTSGHRDSGCGGAYLRERDREREGDREGERERERERERGKKRSLWYHVSHTHTHTYTPPSSVVVNMQGRES